MKENLAIKTLLLYSNPLNEVETDEDDTDRSFENAQTEAIFIDVIEAIGEEDFKHVFTNVISDIRKTPIKKQIELCYRIIDKINEVYNFEFYREVDIKNESQVEDIYSLVSFIEFNNIDFLERLLDGFVIDIMKLDVPNFLNDNWKDLEKRIYSLPTIGFISSFLRTNTKDNVISFLLKEIEKSKTELAIRFLTK